MSSVSKEIVAGVAIGFVVGGIFGHLVSKRAHCTSDGDKSGESTSNTVHKTTSESASELDKYVIENSLCEAEVLAKLRKHTFDNVDMSVMLTDPVEAQLFCVLLKMLNAKKCIEVGTFTGYNALNMALSIPEDGVVYALDMDEERVNHGKPFFKEAGVSKKIDIRIGPGAESMDTLIKEGHAGTVDFVYIDADKANYDTYYEKALVLLRRGGMVALDNSFQGGAVMNLGAQTGNRKVCAEAIHNLNRKVKVDTRVMISLLKIADGVNLCLKL